MQHGGTQTPEEVMKEEKKAAVEEEGRTNGDGVSLGFRRPACRLANRDSYVTSCLSFPPVKQG